MIESNALLTWNRTWPDASPRRRSKDRQQRCLFPIALFVPLPVPVTLPLSTLTGALLRMDEE
jgi:hypothetical protein